MYSLCSSNAIQLVFIALDQVIAGDVTDQVCERTRQMVMARTLETKLPGSMVIPSIDEFALQRRAIAQATLSRTISDE